MDQETEESIESIIEKVDENGERESVENDASNAKEECLLTIARFAIELEEGKRESITAQDIEQAFALCDVSELFEEAKIFFSDEQDAGEDDPEDSEESDEEDEEV